MEEIMVSVEELDFSFRDGEAATTQMSKNNDKQFLKGELSAPRSPSATLSHSKQRLLLQKEQEKQPQKHYSLPSINVQKDGRSNSLVCGELNSLRDKNNMKLENKTLNLSDQFQTGLLRNGKKVLGPIQPQKTINGNSRPRANTNPEVSIPKIKHKRLGGRDKIQPNSTGKQEDEFKTRSGEQLPNGCPSNDSFLDSENDEFLGVPPQTQRRFSAPLSPRFVRRLVPEIFYSKTNSTNTETEISTELCHLPTERRSIFSPTSNDFDHITTQEGNMKQKELSNSKSKSTKSPRKSLDIADFRENPTRFLSEIKVSLTEKTQGDTHRKSRVRTDKRKNSYAALSASSEELFTGNVLPPVKTNMPEIAPTSGRNRASSMSLLKSEMSPKTFDSPMFLDVDGSHRLSHLSLSPRLSRKF